MFCIAGISGMKLLISLLADKGKGERKSPWTVNKIAK
jgi:hypothetical protein